MDYRHIIGVDEVGRGPVAGPVYVSALRIEPKALDDLVASTNLPLRDSKKLTGKMRQAWFAAIKAFADKGHLKYVIAKASAQEIDDKGIAACIRACALSAVERVCVDKKTSKVLLDGGLAVGNGFIEESFTKGDETIPVISLASIVAKVLRDQEMEEISLMYPVYRFEKNKGYGTKVHLDAIAAEGLTELHRKSFLKHHVF